MPKLECHSRAAGQLQRKASHDTLANHYPLGDRAAACFLFAAAVLVAPFDELSRYARNRIYLFRDLGALLGEGAVRALFALLFVAAGVAALRGRRRRGRP